jgi:hypothetical protein
MEYEYTPHSGFTRYSIPVLLSPRHQTQDGISCAVFPFCNTSSKSDFDAGGDDGVMLFGFPRRILVQFFTNVGIYGGVTGERAVKTHFVRHQPTQRQTCRTRIETAPYSGSVLRISETLTVPARAAAILESDEYAEVTRERERMYTDAGIHSVPAVIINDQHLISGGQPAEVFERALRQIAGAAQATTAVA